MDYAGKFHSVKLPSPAKVRNFRCGERAVTEGWGVDCYSSVNRFPYGTWLEATLFPYTVLLQRPDNAGFAVPI